MRLPAVTRVALLLGTAAWIASVPNAATLKQFLAAPPAGHELGAMAFALGGWLFVLTLTYAALVLVGVLFPGRSVRVLCATALIAAAITGYFSLFLGIQVDRAMIATVLQTNGAEAFELLHLRLLLWIALVGLGPAVVAWRMPLRPLAWRRTAGASVGALAVLCVTTLAVVYAQYPRYASAARNHHIAIETVAPANVVVASLHLAASQYAKSKVRAPRGTDAHTAYAIQRPRLLFLVLGETGRASNQGLNGYLRDTTPRMRAAHGFYFPDTESCGTVTAVSVPCMFSGFTRHEFSLLRARGNETLIDVVSRAGARVIWVDNDSGCKDVCARAELRDVTGSADPRWCPELGECHDEIVLEGLESQVRAERRDTLVVLHLKGSHGPAYHKRYPARFERYAPVCATSDLSACDLQSLRNAYDNTVLYTDHVVGETIRLADRITDQFATGVIYVSDHGESLGESGLYLHGMPYAVAPAEQTHVPLYAWVSRRFLDLEQWDTECMTRQTRLPRTHDNVYATVLGFLDIETVEYKPALDLFEPCDPPDRTHSAQAR
jgi:lipid A ethanolaminephosphotransferase